MQQEVRIGQKQRLGLLCAASTIKAPTESKYYWLPLIQACALENEYSLWNLWKRECCRYYLIRLTYYKKIYDKTLNAQNDRFKNAELKFKNFNLQICQILL